jgi:hypothetical protein
MRTLRGRASDLLRGRRYPPERAAQELTRQGVPAAEALRAVNDALEERYMRDRNRARSAMLIGGGVAGLGLLLTLVTVFAFAGAGGGVFFVFTGAIAGGIVEFFRGLSLQPGPPPYLDE